MPTHRENFIRKNELADESYSLKELSTISKVPMKILREVYNRGIGAYKTQPSSVRLKGSYVKGVNAPMSAKLSKEQWAMARVYSFLDGNQKHDNDLRKNLQGSGVDWCSCALGTYTAHKNPPPALGRVITEHNTKVQGRASAAEIIDKWDSKADKLRVKIASKTTAEEDAAAAAAVSEQEKKIAEDAANTRRLARLSNIAVSASRRLLASADNSPTHSPASSPTGVRMAQVAPAPIPNAGRNIDVGQPKSANGRYRGGNKRINTLMAKIERLRGIRDDVIQHIGIQGWEGSRQERELEEAEEELYSLENEKPSLQGGSRPPNSILHQIAKAAYQGSPPRVIGQFHLVFVSSTLKIYNSGNTMIVGIRGTVPTDIEDVKADGLISINKLETSPRYKRDLADLQRFRTQNPNNEYYGVGHSLGGAILDALIHAGLIQSGVSYNPAVQPKDFNRAVANHRIYNKGDPLYNLGKNFIKQESEVRPERKKSFAERLIGYIPYAGQAYDYLNAHALDNFEGGKSSEASTPAYPFKRQLEKAGLEPSSYLAEARRRAKEHHYPYKLLGFATDGIHKLVIPDKNGRLVAFGRVGYGDHIIYSHLERTQKVPTGTADAKRNTFQKSHSKIKGDWASKPFSPNNLALRISW